MIGVLILILAISASLTWLWAGGITYMAKHHPDYKGQDWLSWDLTEEEKKDIL